MKKITMRVCLCIALAWLVLFGKVGDVLAAGGEPAVVFNNKEISMSPDSYSTVSGYLSTSGVMLYFPFTERCDKTLSYEVYRAASATGEFTVVAHGTYTPGTWSVTAIDYSAQMGKTYYYKAKVAEGTDITGSSAVTSAVKRYKYTPGTVEFELSRGMRGVDIDISNVNFGVNNRFDIYRSTSPAGGFKRIKTVYRRNYTDTTVKSGNIYYYKIVPIYYDYVRGKYHAGDTSKTRGIRVRMGKNDFYRAVQNSNTSVKLTWGKVPGVNRYEVWCRRIDLAGDCYVRVGVTKSTAFVAKGLKTGATYSFKLKKMIVSGGRVIGEDSQTTNVCMGYTGMVDDLTAEPVGVILGSDKKTVLLHTNLRWDTAWGASGYKIMAQNRRTGAVVTVATITSGKKNSYRFINPGNKTYGLKYNYAWVVPYRGKVTGTSDSEVQVDQIAPMKDVKAVRKSDAEARVSWKAVPGAVAYKVYRRNEQTRALTYLGETDTTRFDDQYVTTSTRYSYFVFVDMGVDGIWHIASFYLPEKGASYIHKIGTPRISGISNTASGKVTLKWNYVSKAKCYLVYRANSRNGKYTRVGTTEKNNFVDSKAAKGKTYYYKVAAYTVSHGGVASKSSFSNVAAEKSVK